jgi:arsenite-transporting ATPase
VAELFSPLPLLEAPLQADEVTGVRALAAHGADLFGDVEPDGVLCRAPRVRHRREGGEYLVLVPMPGASLEHLDVAVVEDELTITTGVRRRAIKLPRRMSGLALQAARLDGPDLVLHFGGAGEAA